MVITLRDPEYVFKLPIKFLGCSDDHLDTDINFPLGKSHHFSNFI